jgi:hypothetical protein
MDDLSTVPMDDVLDTVEQRLGLQLKRREGHRSKVNGTAGFPTDKDTWVRLSWRRPDRLNAQWWTGFEAAAAVQGVPRPQWQAASSWTDPARGVVWRADEMSLAPDPALSATGDINSDPDMPVQWWTDLRTALTNLAGHVTERVCVTQSHLSTRIQDIYGQEIDTTITDWSCAHGDIGYANLCGPRLTILDWEDWGMAPTGWDAACLWSASLSVPHLADHVTALFADTFNTRSGRLSKLLLCANTARAFRRTGRVAPLTEKMAEVGDSLVNELAGNQGEGTVDGDRRQPV